MTIIRLQDGKPILNAGQVGTEAGCCCGEEACDLSLWPQSEWGVYTESNYSTCPLATEAFSADRALEFVAEYSQDAETFAEWLREHGWSGVIVYADLSVVFCDTDLEACPDGTGFYCVGFGHVVVFATCCGDFDESESTTVNFFQGMPRSDIVEFTTPPDADADALVYACLRNANPLP